MKIDKAKWLQVPYEDYPLHVSGTTNNGKNAIPTGIIGVKGGRLYIPGLDNFNFIIHESVFIIQGGWSVSHLETGTLAYQGAWSDDKEKVIADATKLLFERFQNGTLQAAIDKRIALLKKAKRVDYPINEIVETV